MPARERLVFDSASIYFAFVADVEVIVLIQVVFFLKPFEREQLLYSLKDKNVGVAELQSTLSKANLSQFSDCLDENIEWSTRLSPGEVISFAFFFA